MTSFKKYLSESTPSLIGKYIDFNKDKEVEKILKKDGLNTPNVKVKYVHKDTIKNGDTIIYDEKVKTVNNSNIKKDSLMGVSIFGDNFKNGNIPVKLVIFENNINESKKITKSDFMSLHKKGVLGLVQGMVPMTAIEVFKTLSKLDEKKLDHLQKTLIPTTRATIDNDGEIMKNKVYHETILGKDFFVIETTLDNSKNKYVSWDTIEISSTVYMKR